MIRFQAYIYLLGLMLTQTVWAGNLKDFNLASFTEAQKMNKTIVLEFHATWCSTCIKQTNSLEKLVQEKEMQEITVFKVNFDDETNLRSNLKVQRQSTLVLFKGQTEIGRTIGITDLSQLRSFVKKDR